MNTKKKLQRFLSIFLTCMMILSAPASVLASEDFQVFDGTGEETEEFAAPEETASPEAVEVPEESVAAEEVMPTDETAAAEETATAEEPAAEDPAAAEETPAEEDLFFDGEAPEEDFNDSEAVFVDSETTEQESLLADGATAAADAKVYVTVSNKGVIASANDGSAMIRREVTVKDTNQDGVLTCNEALAAAHAAYNRAESYVSTGTDTAEAGQLVSVSKLWGVETGNVLFILNDTLLVNHVGHTTTSVVKEGDVLTASVNKDDQYYADRYALFDVPEKTVKAGEEFTLTLQAALSTGKAAASGISVGTWNAGAFTPLEGKTTGEDGSVALSFSEPGTYYVTAQGNVKDTVTDWNTGTTVEADCPLIAPACVVTVEEKAAEQVSYLESVKIGASDADQEIFENGKTEFTFLLPADQQNAWIRVKLSEAAPEGSEITLKYHMYLSSTDRSLKTESGKLARMGYSAPKSIETATATLSVGVEGNMQEYTILMKRTPVFESVAFTQADGTTLVQDGEFYYLPAKEDSVYITAKAYGAALTVNGTAIEENTATAYKPQYNENRECELSVTAAVSEENAVTNTYKIKQLQEGEAVTGTWGTDGTWSFQDGVLTIGGTGEITKNAPWSNFSAQIKSVVVESGITGIRDSAFSKFDTIQSITLPDSLVSIGKWAFMNCTGLKSVTIPAGVSQIDTYAFNGCTGLEEVVAGALGKLMFYNCTGLKTVTIQNTVTSIPESAFYGCTSLENIVIPEGVTEIGNYAFNGCTGLKSVSLPASLTNLSGYSFQKCSALSEIVIGGDKYTVQDKLVYTADMSTLVMCPPAFEGAVNVPESVTVIDNAAFSYCTKVTEVRFPEKLSKVGEEAFCGCSSLKRAILPDSVTEVGDFAFLDCASLEEVKLPAGMTSIPNYMFQSCKMLPRIEIPETVTAIGNNAFDKCAGLTEISIPKTVSSIGNYAFRECTGLKELVLPEGITTLGNRAFEECTGLEKVVLSASVTSIGSSCFYGATNVKYVLYGGSQEQWNAIAGSGKEDLFDNADVFLFNCTSLGDTANAPVITEQPKDLVFDKGADATNALQVKAAALEEGAKYYFSWYKNAKCAFEGGTLITGTDAEDGLGSFCTPATDTQGNTYYYCVVEKVDANGAATFTRSDIVSVSVDMHLFAGSGSANAPYEIGSTEDLVKLKDLVNQGNSMENTYFMLTADITLPEDWVPMGKTKDGSNDIQRGRNLYPFSAVLDGKGRTITVPEGGLPLLGYIKNAEVRNLNIYGKKIAGYGLVNNFEGVGLSGSAIVIDNVTLKEGSSTLKSGLIGANITTNGFAGCSAGFTATIRNCTVEPGVVVGYDGTESLIGGIAGRLQGTMENCVSHATVKGVNYVGGLIGTRDNALGNCLVSGCEFGGTIEASGDHAGGIAGGGYTNSTAPNGVHISINNCTVTGAVTGKDKVGGILGGDSFVAQAWNEYTFRGNSFTGTVTAKEGTNVGGIIGFYNSLNNLDDIANNYYAENCGAAKGIGAVAYVDTNCAAHETESGALYFNTENDTEGCPEVKGCAWKVGYNRTDDPLGADAEKLASTKPLDIFVQELKLSGDYQNVFYLDDELDLSGLKITAVYNNGVQRKVELSDVQIEGYDNTTRGEQTLTLTYGGAKAQLVVKVLKRSNSIKVTFSLMGDDNHGESGEVHTQAGGNLKEWVPATDYTVDVNATVYDVLKLAAEQYGFTILSEASKYGGIYVYGIEYKGVKLEEFDNGKNSGWMDTVNGVYPNVSISKQYLEDGDVIVVHYTDDYKREHTHTWDESWSSDETAHWHACTTEFCFITDEKEMDSYSAHQYGEWKVTSKATVFKEGSQARSCTVCGYTEKKTVEKLTPVLEVPAKLNKFNIKKGKTVNFAVTMAEGDSISSVKSVKAKCMKVASVDKEKGTVSLKGLKKGTSKLTIKLASGKTRTYKVKVVKGTVKTSKVIVNNVKKKKLTLKKGKTISLNTELVPFSSTQKVTYKSSKKKVVKVTAKGKVKAVAPGTAKITVKSGKKKAVIKVTVPGIGNVKSSVALKKNKTLTLKPKKYGISKAVTYTSSNKKVATVDSNGKIKGIKKGTATITVRAGSYQVKCKVKVK